MLQSLKIFFCKALDFKIVISFISICLLVVFSPIYSLILLLFASIYFFFKRNFKDLFFIWAVTLFIWHTLFTLTFLDFGPVIKIGGRHTEVLINYLLSNDDTIFWFKGLGYQTVYILDFVSQQINSLIYIPIIVPHIKKTSCTGKNTDPRKPTTSWFGTNITDAANDFSQCARMAPKMERHGVNVFTKSSSSVSTDGKRGVTASQTYVPFMGYINNCKSTNLTKTQEDLLKSSAK
jgi:hypothetical protein